MEEFEVTKKKLVQIKKENDHHLYEKDIYR